MRGSIGLFHDRPDGDAIFPAVGNPPTSAASSLRYSTLQSIGTATLTTAPPVLYIFQDDAKVPSATQWNAGVQAQLPWATVLDVTYAGNHGFNLLQNTQGRVGVLDINAVDFGTAVPGAKPGSNPGCFVGSGRDGAPARHAAAL